MFKKSKNLYQKILPSILTAYGLSTVLTELKCIVKKAASLFGIDDVKGTSTPLQNSSSYHHERITVLKVTLVR